MEKAIYFDLDGTIADLYNVADWLTHIRASNTFPYKRAKAMQNMSILARTLNELKRKGYHIGVISWLSKGANKQYASEVAETKKQWLKKHLKSVVFDEIKIVPYGTPKHKVVAYPQGILFDDEEPNRTKWQGKSYDEKNILKKLRELL